MNAVCVSLPSICTSVHHKSSPQELTTRAHHKSSPQELDTSVHHKSSPQELTTRAYHKCSPQVLTTSVHHKCSPQVFTTRAHHKRSPSTKSKSEVKTIKKLQEKLEYDRHNSQVQRPRTQTQPQTTNAETACRVRAVPDPPLPPSSGITWRWHVYCGRHNAAGARLCARACGSGCCGRYRRLARLHDCRPEQDAACRGAVGRSDTHPRASARVWIATEPTNRTCSAHCIAALLKRYKPSMHRVAGLEWWLGGLGSQTSIA
jgi:hypothetical protein